LCGLSAFGLLEADILVGLPRFASLEAVLSLGPVCPCWALRDSGSCVFPIEFMLIGGPSIREMHLCVLTRPGGDLLSHVLRRSTIGATVLNGRVRDGIGCFTRAITTKP
jgi:hypothetical protein